MMQITRKRAGDMIGRHYRSTRRKPLRPCPSARFRSSLFSSDHVGTSAALTNKATTKTLVHRFINGRFAYLGVSAIQKALPFIILPFLTATLGAARYGEVAVLISCFTLVSMTFGLGLETIIYRYGKGDDEDSLNRLTGVALIQRFFPVFLGLGIAGAVYVLNIGIGGAAPLHIGMAVVSASIYCSAWQLPAALARVKGKFQSYVVYAITYSSFLAAFKLVFVLILDLGVLGWVMADLAGSLVLLALTFPVFLPFLKRCLPPDRKAAPFRSAVRLGAPLVVNSVSLWATGSFDRILIAAFLGTAMAGRYALAAQVVTLGSVVITELTKYIQPHLAPAPETDSSQIIRSVAPRQVILISLVSTLTAVLGAFVAPMVFGHAFAGLGLLSALMTAPLVFSGLNSLGVEYLSITRGKSMAIGVVSIFAAAVSILLNLTLLPQLGVAGAIWALAAASLLTFVVIWGPIMRSDLGLYASARIFWPAALALVLVISVAWIAGNR